MLHDLLRIKKIRENAAREHLKRCRYKVEQAVISLQEKEKALENHLSWRKAEEKRLYDDIMQTSVKERELDLIKQKVILMREKDVEFEEAIKAASDHLDTCREEMSVAEKALSDAVQAVEKFEEFTKVLDEEAAREAARIEELELEEFSHKNRF